MMYGYPGYGTMMGGYGIWLLLFFGLLVLAGLVLLVVWAVRMTGSGGHHAGPADEACAIARARYAKGEITKDQYDEICRTLAT